MLSSKSRSQGTCSKCGKCCELKNGIFCVHLAEDKLCNIYGAHLGVYCGTVDGLDYYCGLRKAFPKAIKGCTLRG